MWLDMITQVCASSRRAGHLQPFVILVIAKAVEVAVAVDAACEHIDPVHDGECEEVQCVLVANAVAG